MEDFKIKAKKAVEWIEALESGKYEQNSGNGFLGNEEHGFCCLGVGCHINKTECSYDNAFSKLFSKTVGLLDKYGSVYGGEYGSLADMNDDGVPFLKIADYIKNNPHELFEEDVAYEIEKLIIK